MDDSHDRRDFIDRKMSDPALIQRYPKRGDRRAAITRMWQQRGGAGKRAVGQRG